jgi:hypothetical protein
MVYLYYRDEIGGLFSRMEMKDDGLAGDDQAMDGIYGASISSSSANLDYYVYAENDSAGTFSPSNAAYNFYEIRKEKQLVINEFCASNATITSDENGDFEDWIEIYNNADTSINLLGYTLSDDINDLRKWSFPDISISPDEYTLVWADNDDDGPLHASFKLASGGEAVYLSLNGEIVDEIIFGGQTTDITYGRYLNGTGPFTLMEASPNAVNDGRRLDIKRIEENIINVFPNPVAEKVFVESDMSGELKIINSQGKMLYKGLVNVGLNTYEVVNLRNGVYFIILYNGQNRITKKLLKL